MLGYGISYNVAQQNFIKGLKASVPVSEKCCLVEWIPTASDRYHLLPAINVITTQSRFHFRN